MTIATRLLFTSKKRMFIVVPPGQGKSRIIGALAVLFEKEKPDKLKCVHILFSSKRLMEADECIYERLSLMLNVDFRLHHVNP